MSSSLRTGWQTARTRYDRLTKFCSAESPPNYSARKHPRKSIVARSTLNKCSSHRPQPLRPPSKQTMHCSQHTPWPEVLESKG
jgi:hypothetical protein